MNDVYQIDIDNVNDEYFEADLRVAIKNIEFPILIVPWNAEYSGAPSFVAGDYSEVKSYCRKALEYASYCKVPRVHIFSKQGCGRWWISVSGQLPQR